MINSISKTAIKLALIQTVPGEEINVRNRLKEACDHQPDIIDSVSLKGLGSFDIILLYRTNDFGYHLSKAGPINGILKSNLLFCYSYLSSPVDKIFKSLTLNSFTGFGLLKISPGVQQKYTPEIEKTFRQYLSKKMNNGFLIGSLGWNEMIFLVSGDDLNSVKEQLLSMSTLRLRERKGKRVSNISVFIKTLSFLGINYKNIPDFDIKKAGFMRTKSFLEQNSFLKDNSLHNSQKDDGNAPVIEVSTKPMYTANIKGFFSKKGFQIYDLLGKQDLLLVPSKDMTWAHFISTVLYFRHKFKDKVFSTNIRLRSNTIDPGNISYKHLKFRIPPISFTFDQLSNDYNETIAAGLASCFFSFNSMSQNPISGSALIDMVDYPQYLLDVGPQIPEKLEFAHLAREVVRYGAELRSYGTFESIEEVTGRFSELRGGCQRALLAVEYLPTYVFKEIGEQWSGFVITHQSNKFDHVNEVIRVPIDTLWRPQKWWALYHEIGHILIENHPEFIEEHLIKEFLRNRTHQEYWTKLILELAAEVIGFELGFFGDYNLFFQLFWKHIVEIDPLQRNTIPIQTYALRSFFTKLFLGCFRQYDVDSVSAENFTDLQYLYNKFIEHLKEIDSETSNALRQTYPEKCFLAAENVKALQDLYPIAHDLSGKIMSLPPRSRPSAGDLLGGKTASILKALNKGKIWWGDISSPQAVIYYLIKDDLIKNQDNIRFDKRIATLLTFWNQQMILLGKRFR